ELVFRDRVFDHSAGPPWAGAFISGKKPASLKTLKVSTKSCRNTVPSNKEECSRSLRSRSCPCLAPQAGTDSAAKGNRCAADPLSGRGHKRCPVIHRQGIHPANR